MDEQDTPQRHWRTHGNNYPLLTGAEALDALGIMTGALRWCPTGPITEP